MTSQPAASTDRRAHAYWVRRPAFGPEGVAYYRRSDGALFQGTPPLPEVWTEPVYSAASFERDAPLKAYFDFTNRCNLTCKHCITSSSPQVDTSIELPTARILELITEMSELGILEMAVAGGEPFIHPDWAAIFRHITATGMNLVITTNGLLLNSKVVRLVQEIAPLEVRVSFDGGPRLHKHVRGRNTYARALRGLALLVQSGIRASARLTLCRSAEEELPQLFAHLSQIAVPTVKVAVVKRAGRAATETGAHLLGHMVNQQTVSLLRKLGQANNLDVQLSADDFPVSVIDARDPKLRDVERPNCGAGFETCYISPQGQLLGCVAIPNLGFGQLQRQPFRDVWQSKLAIDYRRRAQGTSKRRLCDGLYDQRQSGVTLALGRKLIPLQIHEGMAND